MASQRPSEMLPKILANDPTVTEVTFIDNATYQMKQADYTKQIAEALHRNDQLKRLTLSKLNLTDQSVTLIAEALKRNKSIVYLDVSNNKFGNVGLMALADALKENNTLIELSVIGQSQPFGEAALAKMTEMFEYNIILQKINWRLHSRQSFALNKLISRNVDINRRIAAGQKLEDYINIVPGPCKPVFGVASDFVLVEGGTIPGRSTATTHSPEPSVEEKPKETSIEPEPIITSPPPPMKTSIEPEPEKPTETSIEPEPEKPTETSIEPEHIITSPPTEEEIPHTVSHENDDITENDFN